MPDMPTPNPDGAYSSNLPEYESMPDLGGRGDGEYKSENFDADRVWVSGRKAADDRGDYEFQWAMFNRFRLDTNTPRQTEWRTEELDPPVWRTVELGDGMCQQQRQATDKEFTFKYAILLQYYEQWNTNVELEEYYETLGNPITGAAGVGMKLGGLFGALKYNAAATAIETGAAASTTGTVTGSAAAAGSASVVAVGVGTFLATTAVMSRIKKATTVGVTGWQPVGRVKIEERETGNTRQSWVDVGEPYPCPRKRPTTGTPPPPVGRVGGDPQIVPRPDPDAGRRSLNLWWWLGFLLVLLLITVIAVVLFTGGDEAAVVATREPATEAVTDSVGEPGEGSADEGTAGEPSDAVPSDEPAPEPAFELVVPPGYEALASLMALSGFSDMQIDFVLGQAEDDGMGDGIYSSSDYPPGNFAADVDIWDQFAVVVRLSAVMVADAFNESIFECGETVNGVTTVCSADSVLDMPAGDTVMIAQTLSAPVASEPWQYTYAAVLDRDGDPANNFVAQAMFDWDYFQNTDTWYVIDRIEGAWSGGLYHGDFGSPQPSAFRAVISDNTVLWFIPTSELPSPSGVRTTAFRHDGSFAPEVSGGDVIGPDPTIGLSSINPSDIEVGAVGSAVPRGATPVEPVDGPDPDPVELVRAFIGEFETAQDNRDSGFLFETLAPQVIDRYGSAQCEDYLGATVGSVTGFRIDAVNGPVDYTYATDDLVTVVDDQVYAADLRFDANGTELTATANYRIVDGVVSWFTDCGEPVG